MIYDSYHYLYPPRPEKAIPHNLLNFYEHRGWAGQIKKNGTCSVIFTNGHDVIFKTRHADDHKMWTPSEDIVRFFRKTSRSGRWMVFAAELLHNKLPTIKNTLYLFDIIVYDGVQLDGVSFAGRQMLLEEVVGRGEETDDHYTLTNNVWLAKTFYTGHLRRFKDLENIEDEGIVLKNPHATLSLCHREGTNGKWQVKCRRPGKNYGF